MSNEITTVDDLHALDAVAILSPRAAVSSDHLSLSTAIQVTWSRGH